MAKSRTPASHFAAAVVAGLVGILAFNVVDGVFGFGKAIAGLGACIAITVFVVRRGPQPEDERDA